MSLAFLKILSAEYPTLLLKRTFRDGLITWQLVPSLAHRTQPYGERGLWQIAGQGIILPQWARTLDVIVLSTALLPTESSMYVCATGTRLLMNQGSWQQGHDKSKDHEARIKDSKNFHFKPPHIMTNNWGGCTITRLSKMIRQASMAF